jgi:hypothetical protein
LFFSRSRSPVAEDLNRAPHTQAFKFALYVAIPAALTWTVVTNTGVLNAIIKEVREMRGECFFFCRSERRRRGDKPTRTHVPDTHPTNPFHPRAPQRSYVVYPPEGPRPPSPETVHSIARESAGRK